MEFRAWGDLQQFWDAAGGVFRADPVRNTVAMTVLKGILAAPVESDGTPHLISVHEDRSGDALGLVVGAAFCTPPFPVSVSGVPVDAVPGLVEFFVRQRIHPSGVSGPRDVADPFAQQWRDATRDEVRTLMDMRLYRLGTLANPAHEGTFHLVSAEEPELVDLLVSWWDAFAEEAVHRRDGGPSTRDTIERGFVTGRGYGVWVVDGEVVCLAAANAPVDAMTRIGPVYTPPAHRRRGHGAATTAGVARWALDQGATEVLLFTDLANPTSNSIYQRIGFVPVHDAVEYAFGTRHTLEP